MKEKNPTEKTIEVELRLKFEINESFFSDFQAIADHHMEYMIDLQDFPEIHKMYGGRLKKIIHI